VLLIIPAYNEEECILGVYEKITEYNRENATAYDVIVINDGSADDTEKILLENGIPHIRLIRNLGIGGAVQTGYMYASMKGYDAAVQFDGDGQHEISCVGDLVAPVLSGEADMVIGSRFVDRDADNFRSTLARRIGISILSFFIKIFTGRKIYDPTSGFRACGKELTAFFAENYPTEYPEPVSEVAALRQGFTVRERHAVMHERQGGTSSIRAWKSAYYMINVTIAMFMESIRKRSR
ncbi:MAG: glycosyltransferase family 2 protein, partial [Lachnospiraceae bacterium]|nr:glycosyltransferase family 2 protein [Lachnospiraceae bacterium]